MTHNSDLLRQQVIATLASALILSRGSTSIHGARDALEDAKHLLNPQPSNAEYRKWQSFRDEKPLTDEEVKQANNKKSKAGGAAVQALGPSQGP
jgi:hypothetical protein